jgi:hypothetical protein
MPLTACFSIGWRFGGENHRFLALPVCPAVGSDGQDSTPSIRHHAAAKPRLDGANLCTYRTILIFDSAKLLYWEY